MNRTQFDILANPRRAHTVQYLSLLTPGQPISAAHLATSIASVENAEHPSRVGDKSYESVYISLTQTHLPKLADHGLVAYDFEEKTVSPTSDLSQYALAYALGQQVLD